ncbi:hypothetical protein [Paenibacillus sp. B-A-8]|uniref:hypothetical protein n=1 Tax=Paenibacillus sp. B-A-8 TaxID=3400419 RepID=UPI003B02AE55
MKKFVTGILVGLTLFAGTSALAGPVNKLIGAKVQGVYSLEKNGKSIGDAIIIDGKAYAPVRTISEAAGVGLTVEGKTIKMSDITVNETGDYVLGPDSLALANEQAQLRGTISSAKGLLKASQEALKTYEDALTADAARAEPLPGAADALKTNITKTKAEITKLETEIKAAEARVAELQTQLDAMKP